MILPRMNNIISTGTSVTDSSAAPAMEKVLVKASGENSRPSCASSVNTGRNETVMISSEKNSAGPTSLQAARIALARSSNPNPSPALPLSGEGVVAPPLTRGGWEGFSRSRCLCAFSIITMAASTIAPIAIAIPPRLMMLEFMPSARIAMKAISTPMGNITIATSALRTCIRNTMHTSATMALSSSSVPFRFAMARLIRSERS